MSVLWPRLLNQLAEKMFTVIKTNGTPSAASHHPDQIFAPVGGRRATSTEVHELIEGMAQLAATFGYPERPNDTNRIRFDREAAPVLRRAMDLSWAEAGSRDVWSFLAIVALPQLTDWRFGTGNRERWIASDLTRHTWARLWWQAVTFDSDPQLLTLLNESDLNQLLERRSIGGDARLVCGLGRAVLEQVDAGADRRDLIRTATARLRRRLAFVDPRSMTDDQVRSMCQNLTTDL